MSDNDIVFYRKVYSGWMLEYARPMHMPMMEGAAKESLDKFMTETGNDLREYDVEIEYHLRKRNAWDYKMPKGEKS